MRSAISSQSMVSQESRSSRVRIEMDGRTKPLVPEFTIKGAMKDQIDQMASALRERLREA